MKKSELFIATNVKFFPEGSLFMLKDKLDILSDEEMLMVNSLDYKDPTIALLIGLFTGGFGIDRFYIGDVGLGVAKLLTLGACGIWTIADLFFIGKRTKELNLSKLHAIVLR